MIDTHCHLDLQQFDPDREAVMARAQAAGVSRIMNPGVDLQSSRRAVALAGQFPEVFAAVGFHPHEAAALDAETLAELAALAKHPKVRAIGEIGLDYYRNLSPREAQARAFRRQLELAAELNLPVIVHCREAHADVLAMLAEWKGRYGEARGVLHSFSGDRAQAADVIAMGFMIGLTGPLTFPKADEMRAVAQSALLETLLIETDAPYLAPVPHRGQRNEPAFVAYVAEKLAQLRGLPVEAVAAQTSANANRLFDFGVTR